jgi:hypothetical protein
MLNKPYALLSYGEPKWQCVTTETVMRWLIWLHLAQYGVQNLVDICRLPFIGVFGPLLWRGLSADIFDFVCNVTAVGCFFLVCWTFSFAPTLLSQRVVDIRLVVDCHAAARAGGFGVFDVWPALVTVHMWFDYKIIISSGTNVGLPRQTAAMYGGPV